MNISRVIVELSRIRLDHGDIEVRWGDVDSYYGDFGDEVSDIEVHEAKEGLPAYAIIN